MSNTSFEGLMQDQQLKAMNIANAKEAFKLGCKITIDKKGHFTWSSPNEDGKLTPISYLDKS